MRIINTNTLPELAWTSPKGKYAQFGKEVSEALGRDPHSTDLLDRHPFDVEITRIPPGKSACPFHSHSAQWEFYHVISGAATLVTGPELVNPQARPATNTNVRLLNGPGFNAASIKNGVTHQLKAGDVIVIPAGTGHWFTKIDDHITYLMIRVDPDKVTPLKDEAASKADLATRKPK